jgi:hypothetical protein
VELLTGYFSGFATVYSMITIFFLYIAFAIYRAIRHPEKRGKLKILMGVSVAGAIDLALHVYFLNKNSCGADYDPDIGCLNLLPGWATDLGIVLLVAAILLSSLIIFTPARRDK